MRVFPSLALLALLASPAGAIEVDGRIDPDEWRGAQLVTDFRMTQPLSRAPARHPTRAWILATEEGLAVGFRSTQPPEVPRTRQRAQRDQDGSSDRVNVYVDFNGDGRIGYNFTITISDSIADGTLTNENQFNEDWDGNWLHAVTEDEEGWSAEFLVPWHIAPMRPADGDTRRLRISLDRVIGAIGERMSWPAISFREPRFVSLFEEVEVPSFGQSLLVVAPYAVSVYDVVGAQSSADGGADLFWKPHGQFQLSATLNPDFGQVESDQLVVNFDAVETFFDDKRPFFTENQSFFDVPFGSLDDDNRLVYTRRIGAMADDGSGAGDVAAAFKFNGSLRGIHFGVLAATEGDNAGRDFYALRATRDIDGHGLGAMLLRVDRPFLDRVATVYEVDHRWVPNERWNVWSTVVASSVSEAGATTHDSGAQLRIDHDMDRGWRQQLYAVHLGDELQLNDLGFLQRNDFSYLRYQVSRRISDLPESSRFASHDWRAAVSHRANGDGASIADAWLVARYSERRDGGDQYLELSGWTSGRDDLITRGNGVVNVPARLHAFAERFRPRKGRWSVYGNVRYAAEGLGGVEEGMLRAYVRPRYHFNDAASMAVGLELTHNPEWLLWRGGNLLGGFRSDMIVLDAGLSWLIGSRQELQVKLEAIGLDADAQRAWRVAPDGLPVAVDEAIPDFALRSLGFQVRYRYELAPLSYLYVAYVRGGSLFEERQRPFDAVSQFHGAFALRDSEQFLVKLSYRFEM